MAINTDLSITLKALDQTMGAFNSVNKSLNDLKSTALKVGSAILGALAIRDVITGIQDWTVATQRLIAVTGLAADQASRLNYVAKISGMDADEFALAMDRLAKQMFSTATLADKGKDNFTKWGIAVEDARGKTRNIMDVLFDVAERVKQLGNNADATALEMDLFSKTGFKMHEFLMLGKEGMQQLIKESDALGRTIKNEDYPALIAFTLGSRSLGQAFEGLKVQLGVLFLPILNAIVTTLITLAKWIQANVIHSREFAGVIKVLRDAFEHLLGILKAIGERLARFIEDIRTVGIEEALKRLGADIVSKLREWLPKLGEMLDALGPLGWVVKIILLSMAISTALNLGAALFGGILGLLKGIAGLTFALGGAGVLLMTVGLGVELGVISFLIIDNLADRNAKAKLESPTFWLGMLGLIGVPGLLIGIALGASLPFTLVMAAAVGLSIGALMLTNDTGSRESPLADVNFWRNLLGILGFAAVGLAIGLGASIPVVLSIAAVAVITWSLTSIFGGGGVVPPDIRKASCEVSGGWWDGSTCHFTGTPPSGGGGGGGGGTSGGGGGGGTNRGGPPNCGPGYTAIADGIGGWACVPIGQAGGGGSGGPGFTMAQGGIVTQATRAIIGEAGPEAVIPLSRGGMGNTINLTINANDNIGMTNRELADMVGDSVLAKLASFRGISFAVAFLLISVAGGINVLG